MANEATDQVQWDDQVDTSALNTKAAPTSASAPKSAIQWHDNKDTTALENPERYALTHPEAGGLPQAAKSSYEMRPILPSGERVGSMQARTDEAAGTVGEQQAITRREAQYPLLTAAVKAPAKMSAAGANLGRDIAAGYVSGATAGPGGGYVVPQGPVTSVEQLRKERPITMGMAEGVGEAVGGTVADPTNWLLAATGAEAGPVLGKVMSAVFAAKMGKDTYEGTKQLVADWDKLTPEERSEQATKLGINALLTEEASRHTLSGAPEAIKTSIDKARVPAAKYIGIPLERATTPKNLISIPTAGAVGTIAHVIPIPGAPEAAGIGTYGLAGRMVESVLGKEKANTPLWNAPESIIAPETRSQISLGSDLKSAQSILNKLEREAKLKYDNVDLPRTKSVQMGIDSAKAYVAEKQAAYDRAKAVREGAVKSSREGTENDYDKWRQATSPMSEEDAEYAASRHASGYPIISLPDIPAEDITAKPGVRPITEPEVDTTGGYGRIGQTRPVSEATTAEPIPEAKQTQGYTPKKEELIPTGEEARVPAKSAEEYHPAVEQKVSELSDTNLRTLAKAHGINPDEYEFKTRDEGRHRTDRDRLAKDITEQMGDDEKVNLGRAAEQTEKQGLFEGADKSAKGRAERAANMFPRLRGPVDEFGNPKVAGGAPNADEGADVNAAASNYIKMLERRGTTIPKIEADEPENRQTAQDVVKGVQDIAKRYGVDLGKQGFETPQVQLIDDATSGNKASRPQGVGAIQTGGTQYTPSKEAASTPDIEANRYLARQLGDENRAAIAAHEAKTKKPSVQQPLTTGKEVEGLKARSTAQYKYEDKPFGKEGTSLKHEITSTDPDGHMLAVVSAVEDTTKPERTWVVKGSTNAGRPGLEVGYEAYVRLLREAADEANATGQSITVSSDPDMLSEPAKQTWRKLQKREFKGITWKGEGSSARASVTFTPSKTLPKSLGGGTAKANTNMPWLQTEQAA